MEQVEEYEDVVEDSEPELYDLSVLSSGPSRSEKFYGSAWKKKAIDRTKAPTDVMYLNCPRHPDFLMTPIKIFKSYYGYSVTFQCHHIDGNDVPCLIIAQINEALNSKVWMRPGDILDFESWEKALDQVIAINLGDRVKNDIGATSSDTVEIIECPPNPWGDKPNNILCTIWDVFWNKIVENGYCTLKELENGCLEKGSLGPKFHEYTVGRDAIVDWMPNRTGFVIRKVGDSWKVAGRTEGHPDRLPWSDPDYREKFGFDAN